MWYLVCFIVGAVLGAVGMYFAAPKLAAVRAKVEAARKALG